MYQIGLYRRLFACLMIVSFPLLHLSAQESGTSQEDGIVHENKVEVFATTSPEALVSYTHTITIPAIQGEDFLTKDNKLKLEFGISATPISLGASFNAILSPLAFLEFNLGGQLGSGWDIGFVNGLGINTKIDLNTISVTKDPFAAAVWKLKGGAAFQFDLAALIQGDWNHLVFRTYHEGFYRAMTGVGSDVSWTFEAEDPENRNGWNYYGNYVLGYQMPIALDLIALVAESELFLYDTLGREVWGDDLFRWKFGALVQFNLGSGVSLAVVGQLKLWRNFTDSTANYAFYQDRVIDQNEPFRLEFYRIAVAFGIKW